MAKVAVKNPDGKIGYVPAEQVASLPAGWTAAAPDEVAREERLARAETTAQQVYATGEAAARGVSLGLSDVALGAVLGDEYSAGAQARQEANPTLTGVTEVGAGLIAAIGSGGTSAAARGAALTPVGLATRLGAGARAGAQGLTGSGGLGLGARIAQRAIPLAAEGAVEGSIIGAGQAASQASLGNADITAERLLSGAVGGALLGAGAGSAFGLVGGLGSYGLAKAAEATSGARRLIGDRLQSLSISTPQGIEAKARELANESAVKAATGARGTDLRKLGSQEKVEQLGEDILNYRLKDGSAVLTMGDKVEDALPRLKQARKEVGEKLGAIRKEVSDAEIPATKIARQWLDDVDNGVLQPLKSSPSPSIRGQAKHIERELEHFRNISEAANASRKIADDFLGELDGGLMVPSMSFAKAEVREQMTGLRQTVMDMRDKSASDMLTRADLKTVMDDVIKPLTKHADPKIALTAKQYQSELKALRSQFTEPVSYADMLKQQAALKKVIYPDSVKGQGLPSQPPAWASDLQKIERSLEGHMETFAEQALERIQPGSSGAYKETRRLSESFIKATKIGQKADLQNLGNRAISPSDYGIGAAGGLLAGGPAGLVVGAAAGLIHKTIRERGRSVVALLADRVAKSNGSIDLALGNYFRAATAPIKSLSKRSGISRRILPVDIGSRTRRGLYPAMIHAYGVDTTARRAKVEQRILDIQGMANNPDLALAKIQERLSGMDGGDDQLSRPELARIKTQLVATTMRGLNAVARRLPSTVQRNSIQPKLEPVTLSHAEIDAAARIMHAVDKPLSILEDLQNGFVSREAVDVVKEVYPGLFRQMQESALQYIAKLNASGKPMNYASKVEIGLLFDFPATPTMQPDFMLRHQERAASVAEQSAQAAPAPSARKVPQIRTGQTTSERMESR